MDIRNEANDEIVYCDSLFETAGSFKSREIPTGRGRSAVKVSALFKVRRAMEKLC